MAASVDHLTNLGKPVPALVTFRATKNDLNDRIELHSVFTKTGASSRWVAGDDPLVIPVNVVAVFPV